MAVCVVDHPLPLHFVPPRQVENILEATYNAAAGGDGTDYEAHTLSIEVQDVPGVLNLVSRG
jgi:hypothetical protein